MVYVFVEIYKVNKLNMKSKMGNKSNLPILINENLFWTHVTLWCFLTLFSYLSPMLN
ncbi:hypothetical protein HanPSC8_Chr13g0587521 [Helianthus annuus]|nr:hypothetical protein HanPSC8_Chr13g0587521 [Helianthus annuus]